MNNRDDLVRQLSTDLEAVRPAPNVNLMAIGWLLATAVWVVLLTHLWGPIRPNALEQLASEPRFLGEMVVGLVALVVATLAAFRAAIPGLLNKSTTRIAFSLLALWLVSYLFGLVSPALEPSMLGKRPHCMWETLVYALPPVMVGFLLIRRLYPLQPVRSAMVVGLVSGLAPALYMQIACMYDPGHILMFHVLPGISVALVGAAAAVFFWKREAR